MQRKQEDGGRCKLKKESTFNTLSDTREKIRTIKQGQGAIFFLREIIIEEFLKTKHDKLKFYQL